MYLHFGVWATRQQHSVFHLTNFICRSTSIPTCHVGFSKTKMNVDWHQHFILEYHLSVKSPSGRTLYMSFQLLMCGLFLRKSQYMSNSKIVRVN
jgi:hypothetical protein